MGLTHKIYNGPFGCNLVADVQMLDFIRPEV